VTLGTAFVFGNSMLLRTKLNPQHVQSITLGGTYRIASKCKCTIAEESVHIVNCHLDHTQVSDRESKSERPAEVRAEQMVHILAWVASFAHPDDSVIISGDFNASPDEPLHQLLETAGYRSSSKEANGQEPPVTFHQRHECLTKVHLILSLPP
jgi:endonuclease/exonuclease/phosphatase family metal-dependent hydrolase